MGMSPSRVLILVAGMFWATACSDGGVTAPEAPGTIVTGDWSGATSQGAPFSFRVSDDQTVTAITVGRDFGGCRGTDTFSNLSLAIGQSGLPGRVPTPSYPGFGYGSGSPEAPNFTQVTGTFTSSQTATGTVAFLNFTDCGNTVASWNATKR